jgi:hypothetical protein
MAMTAIPHSLELSINGSIQAGAGKSQLKKDQSGESMGR